MVRHLDHSVSSIRWLRQRCNVCRRSGVNDFVLSTIAGTRNSGLATVAGGSVFDSLPEMILGGDDDLLGDIRSKLAYQAAQESVRGAAKRSTQREPPIEDGPAAAKEPQFITDLRRTMRRRRLRYETEKAHTGWMERFARWANVDDPSGLGEAELREFLTDVAVMPIRRMHHPICRLC